MLKKIIPFLFLLIILFSCKKLSEREGYGKHYQTHQDYASLAQVLELIELGTDTSLIKKILGEPIDMGFDYRYLIDSTGPEGCVIGAVFHIDEGGKIDQKWLDEICE